MSGCRRCAELERKVRALGGDPDERPAPPAPPIEVVAPEPVKDWRAIRPGAFSRGVEAARRGEPASSCPIADPRGGHRPAWLAGHASVTPPIPAGRGHAAAEQEGERSGLAGEPSAPPYGFEDARRRAAWVRGWRRGAERRTAGGSGWPLGAGSPRG